MGTANIDTSNPPVEQVDGTTEPEGDTETLHDREVDSYLVECVRLDPIAIDEEFVRLPSDLAYWNECYADATREHLLAKHDAEVTKARVMLEIRETAQATGAKLTVADVEARVLLDARVEASAIRAVEAEAKRQHMRVRCESVMAKRDMLQSLGAKIRMEMVDPVVREQFTGSKLSAKSRG